MIKRLAMLFALMLTLGVVAVGCGDDDDDKASDKTATTQTEASGVNEDTQDDAGGGDAGGDAGGDLPEGAEEAVAQAIESCKQSINSAPQLSAEAKSDLEALCEEAASGDAEEVKRIAKEVCSKIIEESGVPDGAAKDQALAACDQAGE